MNHGKIFSNQPLLIILINVVETKKQDVFTSFLFTLAMHGLR